MNEYIPRANKIKHIKHPFAIKISSAKILTVTIKIF